MAGLAVVVVVVAVVMVVDAAVVVDVAVVVVVAVFKVYFSKGDEGVTMDEAVSFGAAIYLSPREPNTCFYN